MSAGQLFGAGVTGNGIVGNNNGQLVGRSLVATSARARILNPDGISGSPAFDTLPGSFQIGQLIGANGNVTTDQAITIVGAATYIPRRILAVNASVTPGSAIKGGVYSALSKGGISLVAATQGYTALSGSTAVLDMTLAATALLTAPFLYLSLTTANGSTLTFDLYIFGDVLN